MLQRKNTPLCAPGRAGIVLNCMQHKRDLIRMQDDSAPEKTKINETINDYYNPDKATGDAVCQKSVA